MKVNKLSHHRYLNPSFLQGISVSMYTIALEGWRRGLSVEFFTFYTKNGKLGMKYALSNGDREHKFQLSLGDKIPKEATKIGKDKELTKKYLQKNDVPTPPGASFSIEAKNEEIVESVKKIGFPLIIKPVKGSLAMGIVSNITDERNLKTALKNVRSELGYSEVIVERYISGTEYRVYVIGEEVKGVYKRVPANVVGDGKQTIEELIHEKNKIRKRNPHLSTHLILINQYLKDFIGKHKYDLGSVPKSGEKVFLSEKNDLLTGGDSVDVTDDFSEKYKITAIKAANAIEGMQHCGIDMIIDEGIGYVLEINSRPNIGAHLFPMVGEPRDIPKAIVDYYFPETKDFDRKKNYSFYFNLKDILKPLKNRTVDRLKVSSIPKKGILDAKEIKVSGKVTKVGYRQWIKPKANALKLNGYVKNTSENEISIVVAGRRRKVEEFIDFLHSHKPTNAEVESITISKWNKPIEIGFVIRKGKNIK